MCELLALSSLRPTRLTFSLDALASHSGPASRHRDGWGAAFYQDGDVALFREPTAASDSPLVRFLEAQGPSTTLAISHIRRAPRGPAALSNTQPFLRELAGRVHVFAHNGNLSGIEQSRKLVFDRYRPVGVTDSEHAFCVLLERIRGLWDATPSLPSLGERLSVISEFAADLRELGPANFLYADGDALFAHGHRRLQAATSNVEPPGLFVLSRRCEDADESVRARGLYVAPGFQEVSLVASVPLTEDHWQPFAEGELVAVSAGRRIDVATS